MKALKVATVPSFIEQFNLPNITILQEMGYEVDVACNFKACGTFTKEHKESLVKKLQHKKVGIYDIPFTRSPLSPNVFKAYKQLKHLLENNHYDLIHCHTPVAGILIRLASRRYRATGTKVIYTAHGFHFFKGAPLLNWLLYYPIEKLCSRYTDVLITINQEDYELAKNKMFAKKTKYIPGVGVDTDKYSTIVIDKLEKRKELGLQEDDIVLISVGELNVNKNHQVIIKALGMLQNQKVHYVIAGIGKEKENLEEIARELGVNLHLLGYRADIGDILKMSDVFCFPSKREGLGLAAIEAMATGLPLITTNIQGINSYSIEGVTGYKCRPLDVSGFQVAIEKLINSSEDREKFGEYNREAAKKFDIWNVDKVMREIYREVR